MTTFSTQSRSSNALHQLSDTPLQQKLPTTPARFAQDFPFGFATTPQDWMPKPMRRTTHSKDAALCLQTFAKIFRCTATEWRISHRPENCEEQLHVAALDACIRARKIV